MSFGRHYKALCRKNWLLWKRSLGSSITELVCPVALMAIILLARALINKDTIQEDSQLDKRMFYFPYVRETDQTYLSSLGYASQAEYDEYSFLGDSPGPLENLFLDYCLEKPREGYLARTLIGIAPNNAMT